MPTISVIIPAYNVAPYLAEAINSVLRQTRPADEIIVVNDGSTDDTGRVARSFGNKIQYIEQPNGGPAAARNRGVDAARGELIAFLDGDDAWLPRKLDTQLTFLKSLRGPALVCSDTAPFGEHASQPSSKRLPERLTIKNLLVRNRIPTSTAIVPRKQILDVGGFDGRYRGPEDYALWLKLAGNGTPVWRLPEALVWYRIAPNSLSQQIQRMRDQELQIILEFFGAHPELSGRLLRQARSAIYLRAAIAYMESNCPALALQQLFRSLRSWTFSVPEYRREVKLIRLRLMLRSLRQL
jgi:glycosyltransferase involved in cell wall biosynthesis